MKNNNMGFTMIEIMIVVGIITIMATIAIPTFVKFQRKARQSEAKAILENYYVAMKASSAEAGCFRGNFVAIGFLPEGTLWYRVTSAHNASCVLPGILASLDDPACVNTTDNCDGIGTNYTKNWTEHSSCADGTAVETVSNNAFLASAAGNIGADVNDEWNITDGKVLFNFVSGL